MAENGKKNFVGPRSSDIFKWDVIVNKFSNPKAYVNIRFSGNTIRNMYF